MGDTQFIRAYMQRADDTDGPIRFVAATEGKQADGLDLRMDGVRLDRFRKNPVVLYGHHYFGRDGLPIGKATDVETDKSKLLIDVVFDQDDDFAAEVDRKYRNGFLNAVSIGFSVDDVDDDGVVEEWELQELSAVPVPMDADAVVAAGRAGARALRSELLTLAEKIEHELDDSENPEESDGEREEVPGDWQTLLARLEKVGFTRTDPAGSDGPKAVPKEGAAALLAAISPKEET